MASSPASRRSRTPRPNAPVKVPLSTSALLADVISYGYAFVVVWATLQFDLQFTLPQGIGIMAMFVVLRAVAREIHKDARRAALVDARRMAALRAASPSRWSVEQRDGLGRHLDLEG